MVNVKNPLPEENTFKVAKSKWNKWSNLAQYVSNETYANMEFNQELFLHPHAATQRHEMWLTTCWNAAWIAADCVDEYVPEYNHD